MDFRNTFSKESSQKELKKYFMIFLSTSVEEDFHFLPLAIGYINSQQSEKWFSFHSKKKKAEAAAAGGAGEGEGEGGGGGGGGG